MHDLLRRKGYTGPIATPCTLEIDELVKLQWLQGSRMLLTLMRELIDHWLVVDVCDMAMGSADFLGVVRVEMSKSEFIMIVPWKRQYDEGGQICVYHKNNPDVVEIDCVLVQLLELLETRSIRNYC